MLQVSRDHNLKIPKEIDQVETDPNTSLDRVAMRKAYSMAENQKFDEDKALRQEQVEDQTFEAITKIPFNANDLMVITVVKKLGAYVIAVTEKSPKKFRGVFVNRMQNYCLDALECLLQANYIRMDSLEHKQQRTEWQKEAIIKLKLLGYVAMLSEQAGCILKKQYRLISRQLAEGINLTVAWKKSDDVRWKKRISS